MRACSAALDGGVLDSEDGGGGVSAIADYFNLYQCQAEGQEICYHFVLFWHCEAEILILRLRHNT
jgi:hypothetical protein